MKKKKIETSNIPYTCRVYSFVIPCGLLYLPILPTRGLRGTLPYGQHINDFETFKINAIFSNDISLNFTSLVPTITSSTWRKSIRLITHEIVLIILSGFCSISWNQIFLKLLPKIKKFKKIQGYEGCHLFLSIEIINMWALI